MSDRWVAIKLTVFTLVTIAVTVWLAAVIGNLRLFSSPYQVKAEFADASGLLAGDVVKASGVTVGRVASVALDDGIALVTISLDEGVEIPADVKAEIRFRNLVGQRMVALVDEGDSTDILADGDRIGLDRTESAFDLSALFNGLRPLIQSTEPDDINTVSRELVRALEGREGDVARFLGNIADISETIASKDSEIEALLDGLNVVTSDLAARDDQLQQTLADLDTFLGAVAASKDDLEGALVTLDDAVVRLGRIVAANEDNIRVELKDLAIILDAVDDKRQDLRAALRRLPDMLVAVERASSYGQWGNIHLIHVCKDDLGTCGTRWNQ
jgi:phospholipid/cholesterol/gamma-HCH transport system substrate-binding protein